MDEFAGYIKMMILAAPAAVTALIGLMVMEPAMRQGPEFYGTLVLIVVGLAATEFGVRLLHRSRSERMFFNATSRQWASHIRIAQFTGVGCVVLAYLVMR